MTRRRVWTVAGSWLVLSLALWASDAEPEVVVLAGLVAALAAGGFACFDLARITFPITWTRRQAALAQDERAVGLRRKLNAGAQYDSTELHDSLVTIIDDRLLAHRGIDRHRAPDEAAEVLTPRLRALVAGRRRGITAPRELERLLTDIEDL